jgi:hypothetical protein
MTKEHNHPQQEIFICVKPSFYWYKCADTRLAAGYINKRYWDEVLDPFQHGKPMPPVAEGKVDPNRVTDNDYHTDIRRRPPTIINGERVIHYDRGPWLKFNSIYREDYNNQQIVALRTKLDFFKFKFYCFVGRWYNALFGDYVTGKDKFTTNLKHLNYCKDNIRRKIFLLKLVKDNHRRDIYNRITIKAESEELARKLAYRYSKKTNGDDFLKPDVSECIELHNTDDNIGYIASNYIPA